MIELICYTCSKLLHTSPDHHLVVVVYLTFRLSTLALMGRQQAKLLSRIAEKLEIEPQLEDPSLAMEAGDDVMGSIVAMQ